MNVAWQFTAWTQLEKAFRPARDGVRGGPTFFRGSRMTECRNRPNHTVLRDGRCFGVVPGSKLPGYHHSVPPGQRISGFSLLVETQRDQKIDRVLQRLILQLRLAGLAGFLLFVGIEFRVSAVDQGRFI